MPNAIRVKCPSCGTIFRSPKLKDWEEHPEPRRYEDVLEENRAGEKVLVRHEVPTYRGRHYPRYILCRPCSRLPHASFGEHRPT